MADETRQERTARKHAELKTKVQEQVKDKLTTKDILFTVLMNQVTIMGSILDMKYKLIPQATRKMLDRAIVETEIVIKGMQE